MLGPGGDTLSLLGSGGRTEPPGLGGGRLSRWGLGDTLSRRVWGGRIWSRQVWGRLELMGDTLRPAGSGGTSELAGVWGDESELARVWGGCTELGIWGDSHVVQASGPSGCERPGSKDVLLVAGGGHLLSGAPPRAVHVPGGLLRGSGACRGLWKNWGRAGVGFWTSERPQGQAGSGESAWEPGLY